MTIQRIDVDGEIIDLPLAGNRRGIAAIAQHTGPRRLAIPIEAAAAVDCRVVMCMPAGAKAVATGVELGPSRAAERRDVTVPKPHSLGREPIDSRRALFVAAVTAKPILAYVVGQDDD